ncbi:hypothetical protein ACF07U_19505 [Streptomyces californicus]|uniref:hypothetical protein n=1 Tax=Streptomyces californicus TaxID=67351 RepID=UPI0037014418
MAEKRNDPRNQEKRPSRLGLHVERARGWGAVEDAWRRHRAEKAAATGEHNVHDVT